MNWSVPLAILWLLVIAAIVVMGVEGTR